MQQKFCPEVHTCSTRLKVWALITSLALSLIKGIIGVLGRSEALLADGLYSFYQSFICIRSIISPHSSPANAKLEQTKSDRFWFVGLVIGLILALGTIDVFIFSIMKLFKSAQGLLIEPSPYALCAAILSILTNHILSRYGICINQQTKRNNVTELCHSFRLSTIISAIALIGVALSRWGWLSGDALAAIIIAGLLIRPVLELFSSLTTLLKPSTQ